MDLLVEDPLEVIRPVESLDYVVPNVKQKTGTPTLRNMPLSELVENASSNGAVELWELRDQTSQIQYLLLEWRLLKIDLSFNTQEQPSVTLLRIRMENNCG
jgi:hypothetical protein